MHMRHSLRSFDDSHFGRFEDVHVMIIVKLKHIREIYLSRQDSVNAEHKLEH